MPAEWRRAKWAGLLVLAGLFLWSYGAVWRELIAAWNREPDYSHGFLVVPLAVYFLWFRRDLMPAAAAGLAWGGLLLIALAALANVASAAYYIDAVAAWSMILWIGGVVWLFAGRQVFAWALPAIAFLFFMVPLPFRAERLLSAPLQRVATNLSCWTLQSLGQPALAEGNTILLGSHELAVEEACSGMRIFVSIVALAFAYLILVRRSRWEKLLLLASTLPIALFVNATRIVVTGMLYQYVSGEAAMKFSHDLAGWMMILLAAALFALVLWYLGRLVRPVEQMDVGQVIQGGRKERRESAVSASTAAGSELPQAVE